MVNYTRCTFCPADITPISPLFPSNLVITAAQTKLKQIKTGKAYNNSPAYSFWLTTACQNQYVNLLLKHATCWKRHVLSYTNMKVKFSTTKSRSDYNTRLLRQSKDKPRKRVNIPLSTGWSQSLTPRLPITSSSPLEYVTQLRDSDAAVSSRTTANTTQITVTNQINKHHLLAALLSGLFSFSWLSIRRLIRH